MATTGKNFRRSAAQHNFGRVEVRCSLYRVPVKMNHKFHSSSHTSDKFRRPAQLVHRQPSQTFFAERVPIEFLCSCVPLSLLQAKVGRDHHPHVAQDVLVHPGAVVRHDNAPFCRIVVGVLDHNRAFGRVRVVGILD
jgi:hypothetical protein